MTKLGKIALFYKGLVKLTKRPKSSVLPVISTKVHFMNLIRIKAHPKSKHESTTEISDQVLEIWIREPAENNLANHRILEITGDFYQIPINKLQIISGHHGLTKKIQILE